MHEPSDPTLRALLGELDDCWRGLDEVCAALTPRDWSRPHETDWIVADLPYHLACFDRELIAGAILRGPVVPTAEIRARRALREMRASRERIRAASGVLSGVDLDRPVWCPLPGPGWQTVRDTLALCVAHTRSHLSELRQYLQSDPASPDTAASRPCPDLAPIG